MPAPVLTVGLGGEVDDLADAALLGVRDHVGVDVERILRVRLQVMQDVVHLPVLLRRSLILSFPSINHKQVTSLDLLQRKTVSSTNIHTNFSG